MLNINPKSLSLISPHITIYLDKNVNLSITDNLLIVIFYETQKYSLFRFPKHHQITLDFFKEINLLKKLNLVVISIIDFEGNEYFKTEIPIDKSKVLTYTKESILKQI